MGDPWDHWISKLDARSIGQLDGKIRDRVYVRIGTSRAAQLIVESSAVSKTIIERRIISPRGSSVPGKVQA